MDQYDIELFIKDLSELEITLSERQILQFLQYYELLKEWNQKVNLTAITEYSEVIKKHFVDSLTLIRAYDVSQQISVIDVGTGGGFPGLALKIAFPWMKITLLDSLRKRVDFLDYVIADLNLEEIETIHGRAEDYAKKMDYRENFDLAVSRAVAKLSVLSEYCLPFVRLGGCFVSYKSEKVSEEIQSAKRALSILGGHMENQIDFMLPNSDIYRNLVVIGKKNSTPGKYPRKAGMPGKEPL